MRWFKYLIVGLAALVAVMVIGAVIFLITFDADDFKDRAEKVVLDSTGRELVIEGPLDVSLFPWIAVKLADVRLGNATGFSDTPFVEIDKASLGVKLMPLLSRQIEIGEVSIDGLRLNLEINADGRNNWDDLAGDETGRSGDGVTTESESSFATSGIAGLNISNANLTYADAATPADYKVSDFTVKTGTLTPGEPVSLTVSAGVSDGKFDGDISFSATVAADEDFDKIDLTDLAIEIALTGYNPDGTDLNAAIRSDTLQIDIGMQQIDSGSLNIELGEARLKTGISVATFIDAPTIKGTVSLAPVAINDLMAAIGQTPVELPDPNAAGMLQADFSFETDLSTVTVGDLSASLDEYAIATPRISLGLDSQNLEIEAVSINADDIRIDASVTGKNVIDEPQLSGTFTLHPASIDTLLGMAGQPPIETTDPNVLKQLSATSEFQATANSFLLKRIKMILDDSTIRGRINIKNIETSETRFNIRIDQIDLDRYLPPTDESEMSAAKESQSENDSLDALADLDVKGQIKIGKATAMGLKFESLAFGLLAKDGQIRIHPSKAKMYGGSYSGDVRLNASSKPAIASVNEKITGVELSALAADLFEGGMPVSGTAKAALRVELPYGVEGALTEQANGQIDLAVKDGVYSGVDLWHTLKSGVARVRQEAVPAAPQNPQTAFSEFVASGPIEKGRWNTEELRIRLDYGTVSGSGYVDLNDNTLNYQINVVIDDTPEIREDPQLRKLVRASIPISVTGTIDSPRAVPDVSELLKRQVEQATQEKIKKESDKLKEKLEDKLKNLFDN